ncbi:STAS domain-containing protein [Kosmotoga pacifica]|uniref:STAS domain-containing protein n=1 Tax=Kosmotoga pacifica TaxID=1330330 RepID=A0A0G2ZD25_9BACT|nr:STAS domain-containing protein [Kosmotoga pacifica]AKI97449.1 hypothetical protein IX53_06030 [Kosmotoga pacifica]
MVKEIVVQEKRITALTDESFFENIFNFAGEGEVLALNLKNVEMIDSSGIARILSLRKKLESKDSELAIVSPSPYVKKVLLILGINRAIKVVENISQLMVEPHEG